MLLKYFQVELPTCTSNSFILCTCTQQMSYYKTVRYAYWLPSLWTDKMGENLPVHVWNNKHKIVFSCWELAGLATIFTWQETTGTIVARISSSRNIRKGLLKSESARNGAKPPLARSLHGKIVHVGNEEDVLGLDAFPQQTLLLRVWILGETNDGRSEDVPTRENVLVPLPSLNVILANSHGTLRVDDENGMVCK